MKAGAATLHVEVSGHGSPVLLVPGAGGDAGQYSELASLLAAGHTVITYDRRNNSRSPRQADWADTSVAQQADDAVALIDALDVGACTVYGNSTGAVIALAAALRRPDIVTSAVLHEPTLLAALASPDDALASVQPVIAAGVELDGLPGGAEAFLRFAAGEAFERLDPAVVGRIRGNAHVLLEAEFGAFSSWRPEPEDLAARGRGLTVLSAEQTAPFFVEAAEWIADNAGVKRQVVPGGHMGFLDHPAEIAAAIAGSLAAVPGRTA